MNLTESVDRLPPVTSTPRVYPTAAAATVWIPRVVRCPLCHRRAREEARRRISDDEVVVRYGCPFCSWQRTRHYQESALERGQEPNI